MEFFDLINFFKCTKCIKCSYSPTDSTAQMTNLRIPIKLELINGVCYLVLALCDNCLQSLQPTTSAAQEKK